MQKSYDGQTLVVKNLNLDIEAGEFVTMLGPSGSGKTTCLMMLAGFETATYGEIELGGRPINNIPPHKRGIGMVFQNYALFPDMTVAENLTFPLKVRKMSQGEIDEKVRRALDMVQMRAFADRKPAQLSGGQQQRIALARALVFEPELVLMDEPLGALDKQLREHMQYEIKHIHENNTLAGTVDSLTKGIAAVTLDSGDRVKALAVNTDGKGSRTSLSIRPERCIVSQKKSAGVSALKGRIEELIYLGDHIRCRMAVAGNNEFIVKVPNTADQLGLEIGAESYVSWQTDDCRALDHRES